MNPRAGVLALVLIALLCHAASLSRKLPPPEGLPAFVYAPSGTARVVFLGSGFCPEGIHQISDASPWEGVKELTCAGPRSFPEAFWFGQPTLTSGELIEITSGNGSEPRLVRSWMPAAQRIALHIPLHPDRMSVEDWQDLPGIGPVLAGKIAKDRQLNGDFGSLQGLLRVNGVGPRRLQGLTDFF